METVSIIFLFVIGIIIIIKGGDWFVESAVWVAKVTGIPNVIIGATIISIATTLPEQLVSSIATYQGHYDVALGNALGSVICNLGLVLPISLIFSPKQLVSKSLAIKSIFMLMAALMLYYFSFDTLITSIEGIILLIFCGFFLILNIIEVRRDEKALNKKTKDRKTSKKMLHRNILRFLLGALFIVLGARLLVNNGVKLASMLGVSEQIISLTLVAFGTSLPELVTAITSILKKEYGISVGNIIGANILNMLMVVGFSSQLTKDGLELSYQIASFGKAVSYFIPQTLYFDLPVAILMISILTLAGIFLKKLNRSLGVALLLTYIAYLTTLITVFI